MIPPIIREGHGPLTVFLIVTLAAIFLWTAVYFGIHAREFGIHPHGEASAMSQTTGSP